MRARSGAAALLVAVVALVLAGCNFITPQWTLTPYDPSDGVSLEVGDVKLINALVLTEDGENGNLVVTMVNRSDETVELLLQYETGTGRQDQTVTLEPLSVTGFGYGPGGQFFLPGIDTGPGALLPIYVQYGDVPGAQFQVPVFGGSLEQYDHLLPTPPASPEPTVAPTPDETLDPDEIEE